MTQPFPVRLWLVPDSVQVLILVWDASQQSPVRIDTSDETENGRGLLLVEAISEQWGWYFCEASDGKVVWALVGAELHQGHLLCVTDTIGDLSPDAPARFQQPFPGTGSQ